MLGVVLVGGTVWSNRRADCWLISGYLGDLYVLGGGVTGKSFELSAWQQGSEGSVQRLGVKGRGEVTSVAI